MGLDSASIGQKPCRNWWSPFGSPEKGNRSVSLKSKPQTEIGLSWSSQRARSDQKILGHTFDLVAWCWGSQRGSWPRVRTWRPNSRLLPEGAPPTERLLLTELRTGATGRLILIALEGEDADLLAGASKQLATWMRKSGSFYLCR